MSSANEVLIAFPKTMTESAKEKLRDDLVMDKAVAVTSFDQYQLSLVVIHEMDHQRILYTFRDKLTQLGYGNNNIAWGGNWKLIVIIGQSQGGIDTSIQADKAKNLF